jgi:hypothetical protein
MSTHIPMNPLSETLQSKLVEWFNRSHPDLLP